MSGCLLRGVTAYVDIRSPFGGGGSIITQRLLSLGATVEMTRNSSVTHVIFRNGDPATKFWAEKRGIYIVTPTWIKACIDEKTRVPEACYYIKEKEDLELENDFNLIASRNALIVKAPAASFLPNDSLLTSKSILNKSHFLQSSAPSGIKNFLEDNEFDSFSLNKTIPPGWKCLPSPQQRIDALPLPETISSIQEPQPHISDLAGLPFSPDVLNYVRNLASSSPNRIKPLKSQVKKPKRIITPSRSSSITPTWEEKKSQPSGKAKKMRLKSRSSLFRKELLKRVLKPRTDNLVSTERPKSPVSSFATSPKLNMVSKNETSKPKRVKKVTAKPSRRSARLSNKLNANCIMIDSEVTLNSSTLSISSPEKRNSLEDFMEISVRAFLRLGVYFATSSTSAIDPAFNTPSSNTCVNVKSIWEVQRQTLITLLRSCPSLKKLEVTPTINERLCGAQSGSIDIEPHTSRCSSRPNSAKVIAAVLGASEVAAATREQAQRWRLTDHFRQCSTTHLVTSRESTTSSPCPRTINFFKAMIASVPVVDQTWIEESAKVGRWLPHQRFLIPGLPSTKSKSKLRTLFSKIGAIFVASGTSPSPDVLRDLIVAGGGTISKRPFGATLVIGQLDVRRPYVTPKWILESILHQSPLPYDKFRILE
ncbi:hypothetical protein Aperf_G00000079233 [Anoplocephala perfoliata]